MPKSILRIVAFLLVPCLVIEPGAASAFSSPNASHNRLIRVPAFEQQALTLALGGAVFAAYPEPFIRIYHLLKPHLPQILTGASFVIPAMVLRAGGRGKRTTLEFEEWVPPRAFSEDEPYPVQRTVMEAILLSMKNEAEEELRKVFPVVAKENAADADKGRLSSARAYYSRLKELWDDVLVSERPLDDVLNHLNTLDHSPTEAAGKLRNDPRIQFIHWLALRSTQIPGMSVRRRVFEIGSIEMVQRELDALQFERLGDVGGYLHSYFAQVADNLGGPQARDLLDALKQVREDKRDDLRGTGDPYDTLGVYSQRSDLNKDATALFRLIILFGKGSDAFKEAGSLYLSSYLFPQAVMKMLVPKNREETWKWVEEGSPGVMKQQERVNMRWALQEDYRLSMPQRVLLEKLKLPELKLIPEPKKTSALNVRHVLIIGSLLGLGAAAWGPLDAFSFTPSATSHAGGVSMAVGYLLVLLNRPRLRVEIAPAANPVPVRPAEAPRSSEIIRFPQKTPFTGSAAQVAKPVNRQDLIEKWTSRRFIPASSDAQQLTYVLRALTKSPLAQAKGITPGEILSARRMLTLRMEKESPLKKRSFEPASLVEELRRDGIQVRELSSLRSAGGGSAWIQSILTRLAQWPADDMDVVYGFGVFDETFLGVTISGQEQRFYRQSAEDLQRVLKEGGYVLIDRPGSYFNPNTEMLKAFQEAGFSRIDLKDEFGDWVGHLMINHKRKQAVTPVPNPTSRIEEVLRSLPGVGMAFGLGRLIARVLQGVPPAYPSVQHGFLRAA